MLFGRRKEERRVLIAEKARDGIISYCKMNHPHESILILKGKYRNGQVHVRDLVIPPFAETGTTFAGFPHSFLPFDSSYVATMHSHPRGTARPSIADLHNFFGLASVIVQAPYEDEDIFAWDRNGNAMPVEFE